MSMIELDLLPGDYINIVIAVGGILTATFTGMMALNSRWQGRLDGPAVFAELRRSREMPRLRVVLSPADADRFTMASLALPWISKARFRETRQMREEHKSFIQPGLRRLRSLAFRPGETSAEVYLDAPADTEVTIRAVVLLRSDSKTKRRCTVRIRTHD